MSPESRRPASRNQVKAGDAASPIPFRRRKEKPSADRTSQSDVILARDLALLARLRDQIDQVPDIDAARIVELHDRIVRGEYRIDSVSLAARLHDLELDLDR